MSHNNSNNNNSLSSSSSSPSYPSSSANHVRLIDTTNPGNPTVGNIFHNPFSLNNPPGIEILLSITNPFGIKECDNGCYKSIALCSFCFDDESLGCGSITVYDTNCQTCVIRSPDTGPREHNFFFDSSRCQKCYKIAPTYVCVRGPKAQLPHRHVVGAEDEAVAGL